MIVRKSPAGSLTLIGQTDHSRFVGQLAAHWGNLDVAARTTESYGAGTANSRCPQCAASCPTNRE